MQEVTSEAGWRAILAPRLVLTLCILLGGVLLHSMNVLITATLLPSIVAELGGVSLMSWPTTAFVASSIIAASGASLVSGRFGNRRAFSGGAVVYAAGAALCVCAPSIGFVIAGRFVQRLGGGLLSALAYVLVRNAFPEPLWPRVFGLLAGVWSVTVLIGPLIGGVFASYGHWRSAFVMVAGIGCLLGAGARFTLPADRRSDEVVSRTFPAGRIALICSRIAFLSAASVATGPAIKAMLITATVVAFVVMMRIDRRAAAPLLPSDAFSLRSTTGAGLWMVLLMSVGYSPLAIYAPLFLQRLHGVSPLGAGYMVALASLAWTTVALSVASLSEEWPPRLIIMGPTAMGAGLAGVGILMAPGPVAVLVLPIVLIGAGIGAAWAFVLQRLMSRAKGGEENIAAASAATVQQAGIALGAAAAGLVANASALLSGILCGGMSARQTNPRSWAKIVSPNMILRSAVPYTPTAFQRLLEPLDRRVIARAVAAHDGDRGVGRGDNAWTCERHLKSLLFAQLAGLTSLRQIVTGLGAHSRWFYHLNLRAPCRSTLADANTERPAAVFRDIALALIPVAAGALRSEGEALIRLLDATPIPLKGDSFPWAEANARTRGLKLHLLYDSRQRRPVWFDVTSAKIDDVVAGRAIPLEKGATYVFDKGYTDYRWWSQIIDAGAIFVTRRKRNAQCRDIREQPASGDGILADRRLKIGHRQPRGGAPINPLYQTELREITVARPDHDQPLHLLTNDFERSATDIAELYKERWDIELLFKWLKQNLKIRRFLGRSENAVRIQIYVALIAFLLLRILHQTAARSFKDSTALLLTRLKLALFGPFSLCQHATPPPRPPALRPPNPQTCFAFQ